MAKPKKPAPPPVEGAAPAKKLPVPLSTIIAFLIAVPVGYMTFNSYRNWASVRSGIARVESEFEQTRKSNVEMEKVYSAVQLKKYEICNKSAEEVTVSWVSALYHDASGIKVFDSDRCQDWQPVFLNPGDNKKVLLRSAQPGCNWNGDVFYYAMRYSASPPEAETYRSYNLVGPYQGFDRDCYPIN